MLPNPTIEPSSTRPHTRSTQSSTRNSPRTGNNNTASRDKQSNIPDPFFVLAAVAVLVGTGLAGARSTSVAGVGERRIAVGRRTGLVRDRSFAAGTEARRLVVGSSLGWTC